MYTLVYTLRVTKEYSIAEARQNLPRLVNEAEAGSEVRLTRRGRPVAVVVSLKEFERLRGNHVAFAEAYRDFHEKHPEGMTASPATFRALRDRSVGRKVAL